MGQLKPKILKSFGQLVKERRLLLGISQEELGLRANLDRTYISGIERGVRNPSLTALVDLAQGLGVSTSEMLDQLENVVKMQQ